MKVLAPGEPMWTELNRVKVLAEPVAIRVTPQWPEFERLMSLSRRHPEAANTAQSADGLFDYAVWRPTSRAATRLR